MNAPQVRGITGVLDGILSPPTKVRDVPLPSQSADPSSNDSADPPPASAEPVPTTSRSPSRSRSRPTVRRGRPPGKAGAKPPKEKMTVWIERSLIDAYRDWTWHARCQLSHLVERALAAYHEQHHGR